MSDSAFLSPDEVRQLSGCARRARQVAQLRRMGVTFYVNAAGMPVVPRGQFDGTRRSREAAAWTPSVVAAKG